MTSLLNALPGALSQGLIWGIMAIGLFITYKILELSDLTVDGSFCTGGAVCAMLMVAGYNVWVALLVAMLAGMVAGWVTSFFHTKLGIPAILSGILTQLGLWSVNLAIMGMKANQALNVNKVDLLVSMRYLTAVVKGKEPFYMYPLLTVGLFTVAIVASLYWFFGTELGASIRATGANVNMARAQGINTNMNKLIGLMISNGLVALSGAFIAQNQSFADVQMGTGSIVIGLASLIIGEVLFNSRGFYGRLFALILGALVYRLIIAMVLKFGMNPNDLKLFTAITVAIALWLPQGKEILRTFTKSLKKEAA